MEDEFLLPDVLLGDLFALVMNRTPEEIASAEERLLQAPAQPVPLPAKPRALPHLAQLKKPAPPVTPHTSKESMRLFTSNTYPVGTIPNWGGSVIPLSCDACGVAIRRGCNYMRCCECVRPMVDLCVLCFANGAEFGEHKRTHSYSVVKNRLGNRKLLKLDVFDMLDFLSASAQKGSLNFSEFENAVLHFASDDHVNGAGSARRFGGRGVRATVSESVASGDTAKPAASGNLKQTTDAEKIYLSLINMLTGCREELSVDELVAHVSEASPPPLAVVPGPANYNSLREEFEFEFLPEAETILAAVTPPTKTEVPADLIGLMEGYNGILDERERRKRTLVSAGLTSVKEFTTFSTSQKKRKTDEKEAFEKSRIFLRAVSESLDTGGSKSCVPMEKKKQLTTQEPSCSASVKFLDHLASHITTRKRLIDRLKRLSSLWKHGLVAEDHSALQFDIDRKKRNDLNAAKVKSNLVSVNSKVWTHLPNQTDIGGTIARTNRGHLVSDDFGTTVSVVKISPIDILQSLPGGAQLNQAALQLCLEYYITPQHYIVVELAIHALLRHGQPDEKLRQLVKDGIFGTTRRYIQGGGGPQTNFLPYSVEDMKNSLIKCCRDSFK